MPNEPEAANPKRADTLRGRAAQVWVATARTVNVSGIQKVGSDFRALLTGPSGIKGQMTLLGRLIVRVPAIVPGLLVAFLLAGTMNLAADMAAGDSDPKGLATYGGHAFVAIVAAILDLVILLLNIIFAGISSVLKLALAAWLATGQAMFDALFGSLFEAVNGLGQSVGAGNVVEKPEFHPEGVQPGRFFSIAYLVPGAGTVCGGIFAPHDWEENGCGLFRDGDDLVRANATLVTPAKLVLPNLGAALGEGVERLVDQSVENWFNATTCGEREPWKVWC